MDRMPLNNDRKATFLAELSRHGITMRAARAEVEHEFYRRAQEGVDEPVFGGKYKERIVGTVRRYSDRLLELRARAMLPAYRDIGGVHVAGRVTHDLDDGLLGDAVASFAMKLASTFRPPAQLIEATVEGAGR